MNLPLNIDWQQILLHLLNFSILTLGLYLLLYQPVKSFMEKRSEHYGKLQSEIDEKKSHAEQLERSYQERLENAEQEINEKRALAALEAQKMADALLEKTKQQAEKLMDDARQQAQKERAEILQDAQQEIVSMAMEATEKLLAKSTSGALDQFLDAVKEE